MFCPHCGHKHDKIDTVDVRTGDPKWVYGVVF